MISLSRALQRILPLLLLAVCLRAEAATWVATPNAAGATVQMRSVWSADNGHAWSVGGVGTSTPQIIHWNGSAWVSQTSPVAKSLYSVWGTDTSHVWIGGRDGTLLFYDGTVWTSQTSPLGTGWFIYDIWGLDANNVWAVAGDGNSGRVLKLDGGVWTVVHSTTNGLQAIWGFSANNIWVVGLKGSVLNFNNGVWTDYPTGLGNTSVLGVWGSDPSNVWIVGGSITPEQHSVLLKWDGDSLDPFSTTGLPTAQTTESFRGVMGSSATNVYIVGGASGFISRWNGTTWATETSNTPNGFSNCWCNPAATDLLAVGAPGLVVRGTAASSVVVPTVATPTSTAVTANGATLGGNITATGGANATVRGVVYALTSQNPNPEIGGADVTVLSESGSFGTGAFTRNATSLFASTGYSYKAYATNSAGTSYSSVGTFTTLADSTPPTVVSVNRSNPSGQAITNGNVVFRVTYSEPVNLATPLVSHYAVMPVNGSNIAGTVTLVTPVSTSVYDVSVSITSGTGEFRLRVLD